MANIAGGTDGTTPRTTAAAPSVCTSTLVVVVPLLLSFVFVKF
jgi:hypothetical protein